MLTESGLRQAARTFVLIWAGLCAFTSARAQQGMGDYRDVRELPDTPAGKRVAELIETLNSDDPQRVRRFIEDSTTGPFREEIPLADHQQVFREVATGSGGVEFYGIRQYEQPRPPGEIVAIVRGKLDERWRGLVVNVQTEEPHKIVGIQFAPARPPHEAEPPPALPLDEALARLSDYVNRLVAADTFSGTVLIARDGKVIFERAAGQACKRYDVPNRIDTKFNLGSMNKMFTAVAIAQLAEQDKLSYTDPVSRWLSSDWLPAEVADRIAIEHLLTHTSGLGSYFNERFMSASRDRFRKVDDYRPLVAGESLRFEPGSDWGYSNTGFLLLGAIIEKVSGQDYFDYVRAHIYQPAGMTNSDCYDMDRPVPNLAMGYSRASDGDIPWTDNLFKHVIRGGPAGGGFATVHDLLKFDQTLRSGKLIKSETAARLWTPKPQSPNYGYGFSLEGQPSQRIVGHGGGFPGISAKLEMHLDSGFTIAVLSNYDGGAMPIADRARELLTNLKP